MHEDTCREQGFATEFSNCSHTPQSSWRRHTESKLHLQPQPSPTSGTAASEDVKHCQIPCLAAHPLSSKVASHCFQHSAGCTTCMSPGLAGCLLLRLAAVQLIKPLTTRDTTRTVFALERLRGGKGAGHKQYMEKQHNFRYTSIPGFLRSHFTKNCIPTTARFTFSSTSISLKKTAELWIKLLGSTWSQTQRRNKWTGLSLS